MVDPYVISQNAYTVSNGSYAGIIRVEDFEDGNRAGWNVPGSSGSDSVVSPGLNNTQHAWKLFGPREGHLPSSDAIERGPSPGETFEFRFRITDFSGSPSIFRFDFACTGNSDGNMYRIEFEGSNTGGADMSLEKYSNGNPPSSGSGNVDTAPVSPSVGDNIHIEVEWHENGNNIAVKYRENGTLQATVQIADSEYGAPGVCVEANAFVDVLVDEINILP